MNKEELEASLEVLDEQYDNMEDEYADEQELSFGSTGRGFPTDIAFRAANMTVVGVLNTSQDTMLNNSQDANDDTASFQSNLSYNSGVTNRTGGTVGTNRTNRTGGTNRSVAFADHVDVQVFENQPPVETTNADGTEEDPMDILMDTIGLVGTMGLGSDGSEDSPATIAATVAGTPTVAHGSAPATAPVVNDAGTKTSGPKTPKNNSNTAADSKMPTGGVKISKPPTKAAGGTKTPSKMPKKKVGSNTNTGVAKMPMGGPKTPKKTGVGPKTPKKAVGGSQTPSKGRSKPSAVSSSRRTTTKMIAPAATPASPVSTSSRYSRRTRTPSSKAEENAKENAKKNSKNHSKK